MNDETMRTCFSMNKIYHPVQKKEILCYDSHYKNLYETLHATAKRFPHKTAIVDAEGEIDWQTFCSKVDHLSDVLYNNYGLRTGQRIGLLMMNSIQFCCVFYAAIKIGAIVVVLNTKSAPSQIQWALNNTGATMLFSDNNWHDKVLSIVEETSVSNLFFGHAGISFDSRISVSSVDALLLMDATSPAPIHPDPYATAVIMYTSGTTGTPKGACISHFNILQNVLSYVDIMKIDDTDCTVIGVPLFHITGLSCLMALFVYVGGQMILMPKFNAATANQLMRQYQATHVHAVPSIFIMLSDAQAENEPITSLRTAVCGGGPITADTIRHYCSKNPTVSFHCAYGMTETAGAGVLFPCHYFEVEKTGSSGKVVPNTEIQILDETGSRVPVGCIGEIGFGGSVVISQYWATGTAEGFRDGLLMSGDIGKIDENGYVYVLDRKKDMINRSGEKIFSLLVEKEIYTIPDIDMCAVFPVFDKTHGEVAAAYIVLRPGSVLRAEDIQTYLYGRLAKYEVPQYIEIVDQIPLTPNNKISKIQLRRSFEEQHSLCAEK